MSDRIYKVKVRHYPKEWDSTGKWQDALVLIQASDMDAASAAAVEYALGTPFFGANPKRVMAVQVGSEILPMLISKPA